MGVYSTNDTDSANGRHELHDKWIMHYELCTCLILCEDSEGNDITDRW